MKKKMLAGLLAAAMVMTALTGCGAKDSSTKPAAESTAGAAAGTEQSSDAQAAAEDNGEVVELEFWAWWSSDARKPYVEQMVQDFNDSQSKYHVTYVDIPWGDIFTKNIAQIAAGKPCDIMANSMEEVKFRAQEGQAEPIDAYLTDDVKNAFYEQYMDACTGDDGSVYALPLSVDTRVIYYNKAQFEEAGINADEIKTWADLEEAAHKLDVKDGDRYSRIGFMPTLGNGGVDTWLINANKKPCWFDPETGEPTVNSDVNKEAFAWVRSWIEYYGQSTYDEFSAAFSSGMTDPFASGAMSMLVQTSAYTSSLAQTAPDLDYGIMLLPEFKEGNGNTVNGGGFVLEIPKGAKCPEGSYEFIKFVTSYDTQDFLCSSLGDFSARNDFDENTKFFKKPHVAEIAEALEQTSTVITPNEIKGYQDVVNPLVEEGTLGIKSTDAALDNAQKAFEDFKASN
ncbi:ABC transporter substrate-binding protein [Eisenbergiella tayi]|uniref:Putative arabinose-binding protein n=1 Tax=Eisenbergiella tayi TaxID=1432052 RepID=A0A1E3AEU9_9FIRM|nr:ABC transporter substrate-binding protein [Eisenbergiella tayi]ODM07209.1 putative arabinose-binding protein precursor [Eisenbergiella tayi]